MFNARWFMGLAGAVVLALSMASASSAAELFRSPEVSSVPAAPTAAPLWKADGILYCNAWVVTNYWSDASHTTKVGQCSITCTQYTQVTAYPTFTGGGTCTGVSSPYTNQLTTLCRCVP